MHYHFGPADALPSSPPPAAMPSSSPTNPFSSPTRSLRRKERRLPSVTPRRFTRFFTPRSNMPGVSFDRLPLADLNSSAVNEHPMSTPSSFSDALSSDAIMSSPTQRVSRSSNDLSKRSRNQSPTQPIKRRRGLHLGHVPLPPLQMPSSSPLSAIEEPRQPQDDSLEPKSATDSLGDRRRATLNLFFKASRGGLRGLHEKSIPLSDDIVSTERRHSQILEGYTPTPIRKFQNRGFESQLVNREHGFSAVNDMRYLATPAYDPRIHTASFYSRSCDSYMCSSLSGHGYTIPFSLASCHKAAVTAVGDEQGYVRLFNTTTQDPSVESKVDVHFKVHDNAIMDLAFSNDDLRLATACGDRTGRIIDVMTQTVAVELNGGHCDSLRQIAFQPGPANGNTLATSDRAGRVQIWDLRCSPMPVQTFSTGIMNERDTNLSPLQAKTVNTIDKAHERRIQGSTSSASVTALQWLPEGREHLLLTASESNACIKLWDTRYIKPRRQTEDIPLATTPEPRGHAWRSYGITSLALSSDAARLYAVCKDSTVYAYSTSHLLLGHAPSLENGATKRRPQGEEGMGPLFGFKHDLLGVQSFYVKCAIRPATDSSPELLAVGGSNNCAVLFPTDERYMRSSWSQNSHILNTPSPFSAAPPPTPMQAASSPFFSFSCSTPSAANASGSTIPICKTGTPLIRGHGREVTTLSWSHDGKLVTASDDYVVRQWQENADEARHLRTVGEFGGERHMAGWADVAADWDEDDD